MRPLLIDAGFPKPTTQIPVVEGLTLIAMLDMGWAEFMVAAEYDGDHHRANRKQYAKDQWRSRKIASKGWINVRVIAEDREDDIIDRVWWSLAPFRVEYRLGAIAWRDGAGARYAFLRT